MALNTNGYESNMGDIDNMLAAWGAGDYATIQNIINRAGYNDQGLMATYGLGAADIDYIKSKGVTPVSGIGNPMNYEMWSPPSTTQQQAQTPQQAQVPQFSAAGGSSSGKKYEPNPYLTGMAEDITRRTNMARDDGLNAIRSSAVGVGGLGGSRQGIAEGVAIGRTNDSLSGNIANLFGTDWTNAQNRELGWGNLELGNRNADLNSVRVGADLYNMGNAGYMGQGQGVYDIGNTQQQAGWQPINNASSTFSPYTGYGATSTSSQQQGGGASGMLGGALGGAQLAKGWFGGGGTNSMGNPIYSGTNNAGNAFNTIFNGNTGWGS